MKTEKHYHICEMSLRVKSCSGKHSEECENIKVNGECHLPEIYGVCSNFECQTIQKLDHYKNELENSKSENSKLKALNTQFRVLMLMPTQAERLIKDNTIDFSGIKGLIERQSKSWDSCDETTGLYMMEYHQKFAEAYAVWLHEKNSKIQIQDLVNEAKKGENKKALARVHSEVLDKEKEEKERKKKEEASLRAKTPFGRAVQNYMKMGKSEEDARKMCLLMGMKE